jgi:hypothetical protein
MEKISWTDHVRNKEVLLRVKEYRNILHKINKPDSRNTPLHTNPGEEGIADAPGNDGNASMPEQVKRPNPWRKMMMMLELKKQRASWFGHILRRNCLLQQVSKRMIKGGIEVKGRRKRRRRKLLDDLKEGTGYSHLKEKALDRTMQRACFKRSFGLVVRQTTK